MYNFKFNEKEYNFPDCWDDILVEDFIKILKLEKQKSLYQFDELYAAKLVEILLNIEEEVLNEFDLGLFGELVEKLFFLQSLPDYTNKNEIILDGVKYVTPQNLNKLTLGEYASIKTLTKDKEYEEQILLILSIILRPEGEKFEANKIGDRVERFKKLRIIDVNEAVNFFLSGK
jgi:hypothetical protein